MSDSTQTGQRDGERVVRYSLTDTAALVRKALAKQFPGQAFSVRSHSYSGGCRIDVTWTDGPTRAEVEAVAHQYQGATWNSSDDSKSYKPAQLVEGVRVKYGVDWVSCQRSLSAELLRTCAWAIAAEYHVAPPAVTERTWRKFTSVEIDRDGPVLADCPGSAVGSTAGDLAIQLANTTSTYKRPAKSAASSKSSKTAKAKR